MENYKSQMNEMVTCSECGVKVHVDDAEASYNAEIDDVFFYCSKCINDPAYLPAVSDDSDEAVEHTHAADEAWLCEICGDTYLQHQVAAYDHLFKGSLRS